MTRRTAGRDRLGRREGDAASWTSFPQVTAPSIVGKVSIGVLQDRVPRRRSRPPAGRVACRKFTKRAFEVGGVLTTTCTLAELGKRGRLFSKHPTRVPVVPVVR